VTEMFHYVLFFQVMKPLATVLDKLQGDKNMTMGHLLPLITILKRKLVALETQEDAPLTICQPLATALVNGIDRPKRFGKMLEMGEDTNTILLAAITEPKYKTYWMLTEEDKNKAKDVLLTALREVDAGPTLRRQQTDVNDFFRGELVHTEDSCEEELNNWLTASSTEQASISAFRRIKEIYLQTNTLLPTSASSERMFSKGKDLLQAKRNRMKDKHFEMRLLLSINRENKRKRK